MTTKSFSITKRDIQILIMVYAYGGVTTEQVRLRFWPGSGRGMPCYRRIKQLVDAGYLQAQRLPSEGGVGSGKLFLTPGSKSWPILAQTLGLGRSELARGRMKAPGFIQHHLALCDLRLAIELGTENSTVFTLGEWMGEREIRDARLLVDDPKTGEKTVLIPDASFTLMLSDGTSQKFVVEMDMGTIPRRLKAKLRAYLIKQGEPTPVLFVVPDQDRQETIAYWALEEAEELGANPNIFWISSKEAASKDTLLSYPIWQVVGRSEALAIESLVLGEAVPEREDFAVNGGLVS